MSHLIEGRFISVSPSLNRVIGLTKAVVLQEIYFTCQSDLVYGQLGEMEIGQRELAQRIGISRDAVHRALKALIEGGWAWIQPANGTEKRKYVTNSEVVNRLVEEWEIANGTCAKSGQSLARIQASACANPGQLSGHIEEVEEEVQEDPPVVPQGDGGNGDQPQLPIKGVPETQKQRRNRTNAKTRFADGSFEIWWKRYLEQERGGGSPGDKGKALANWRKLTKQGVTATELCEALEVYIAARVQAYSRFGAWPTILNGSTFLSVSSPRWINWVDPLEDHDERCLVWERVCRQQAERDSMDEARAKLEEIRAGAAS